jgi:hypothetical protein
MNVRFSHLFLAVILAALCGCTYGFRMEPSLPDTEMLQKSPLRVAVYIPQSTLDYREPKQIKNICAGGGGFAPNDFGIIFAETVKGTMAEVFREAVPISRPFEPGHDFVVQAEMLEMIYKFGCMGDPGGFYVLRGSFRAVDGSGKELWRSPTAERKTGSSGLGLFKDAIPSIMASLVGDWTKELLAAPEIQRFAGKAGKPAE